MIIIIISNVRSNRKSSRNADRGMIIIRNADRGTCCFEEEMKRKTVVLGTFVEEQKSLSEYTKKRV